MRVLVTRPEEDAKSLVAALQARGHEALVESMMTIVPANGVGAPLDLDGVQALLFTSANGVRAFAHLSEARGLPVFAVGEASAAAARAAGFATVESAAGDVTDLARLVRARLDPADGALYHAAASRLAGDLKGELDGAGFTLRREVLYEAKPATELSGALRRHLNAGDLDVATFFSPRTAETFVSLIQATNAPCTQVTALALSEAVAENLRALDWREVLVAERPNQDALLARLDALAGATTVDQAMTEDEMPQPATTTPQAGTSEAGTSEAGGASGTQQVIERFGGIRPMAGKLGVAVSTVQGWRERGVVPVRHHERIRAAARQQGFEIDARDLADDGPATAAAASAPAAKPGPQASAATRAAAKPKPATAQSPKPKPEAGRSKAAATSSAAAAPQGAADSGAWLRGFVLGALVFVVGAGGAVLSRDLWMPLFESEYGVADGGEMMEISRRIAALESAQAPTQGNGSADAEALQSLQDGIAGLATRLDSFESRLESLAAAPTGELAGAERLAELSARLDELGDLSARLETLTGEGARLTALEVRIDELSAQGQKIDDLAGIEERIDERIAGLTAAQGATRSAASGEAAFTIAVLQLRDALRGSGPFASELGLLQELAASGALPDGAALGELIAPLAPHAESGIPSLSRLQAAFPKVARAVVVEDRTEGTETWVAGVLRRVSDLVTLRPVGPVQGRGAAAVVARAEADLMNDDLAGALDQIQDLQGPAAAAAKAWRVQAEARLTAGQALTGLGRLLFDRPEPAGG